MRRRMGSGLSGAGLVGMVVAGLVGIAPGAAAQLARLPASPTAPKLLVAPFGHDSAADSSLATLVADAVRQRMIEYHGDHFQTITKKAVCDFLVESGFACTATLDPAQVGQLANVMNARYMVDGAILPQGSDSVLVLGRLLQAVRTNPLAAGYSMVVARDKVTDKVGDELADRLSDKFRAFRYITDCRSALTDSAWAKATDAAQRALRLDAGSASAYLCLAMVRQGSGQPADSVVAALERAHDADSLNTVVSRQLYQLYQQQHDTTQMLAMLRSIMNVDTRDNDVRKVAVELYVRRGHPDSAVMVLNQALNRDPHQFDLLVLKAIALAAQNQYAAADSAISAAAAADSTKVDSLFLDRAMAVAAAANDTTLQMRWWKACTVKTPSNVDCWFRYGAGQYATHDTAGAIATMQHVVALHPEGGRAQIALATYFAGAGRDDSAQAEAAAAVAADTSWRPQAAAIYLRAANTALQAKDYPKVIGLLTTAQPWATGETATTLGYMMGVSQFQIGLPALTALQALKVDQRNRQSVDSACALVKTITDNFTPAQTNMTAGARLNPDVANQILTYIGDVLPKLDPIRTRLKCGQ